jgi:hypothetical protein
MTVDTSVANPDVGTNVSATSPAAVDSKDSTPKLLIGAASRGHDRSSLVDCTNTSAAATANTSVSIMLSTFIDSPDKAAMHQSSSSTCRSINISSLSTGGGVNNSQFSVSTQQAQSLDQQHKATNTSETVVASSPPGIAPCLSPITPQEEIVKRQRYLKDWLGKLKDRGMSHTTLVFVHVLTEFLVQWRWWTQERTQFDRWLATMPLTCWFHRSFFSFHNCCSAIFSLVAR